MKFKNIFRRRASNLALGYAAASAVIFSTSVDAAAELVPLIPDEGKKVSDFVPSGWTIFNQAEGDLNGDGRKDYAFILVKKGDSPASGYSESFSTTLRPLVVLHNTASGVLKKACVSPGAIMHGSTANNFALLAVSVKIEKGNVVVNNGNGATAIQNLVSKYRLQGGKYELIGLTTLSGSCREGHFIHEDLNLNTRYEIVEERIGVNMASGAVKRKNTYSFYCLRAGSVKSVPPMNGVFVKSNWQGPSLVLNRKANVVLGTGEWRSPDDLSAELHGVHTKSDLFIVAKVHNKSPNEGASIRLAGPHKKYFKPDKIKTTLIDGGELIEASFRLSALRGAQDATYGGSVAEGLELSVQVVEPNQTGAPQMVLSTSCDGERHNGKIKLTKTAELPRLETWDWESEDE